MCSLVKRLIALMLAFVTLNAMIVSSNALEIKDKDGFVFNSDYYAENNPDVVETLGNDPMALYKHFENYGKAEGRIPSEDKNTLKQIADRLPSDDTFEYVALGNSVTIHGETEFWWNKCGMAASDANHDYLHQVVAYLRSEHKDVDYCIGYLGRWEDKADERNNMLSNLDYFLSADTDLVTIQLGENVFDVTNFESDYQTLVAYVCAKAPNAKVILIGDFWYNDYRARIKKNTAKELNLQYIDLYPIAEKRTFDAKIIGDDIANRSRNVNTETAAAKEITDIDETAESTTGSKQAPNITFTEYERGLGGVVYDEKGNEHIVESVTVGIHPNDEAMTYIANKIIDCIQK